MKNFLGIALILGITMISCSKDKTDSANVARDSAAVPVRR